MMNWLVAERIGPLAEDERQAERKDGDGELLQARVPFPLQSRRMVDSVALALPALKRMIGVETLSQSAKALLPPHKCGGSHQHPFALRGSYSYMVHNYISYGVRPR